MTAVAMPLASDSDRAADFDGRTVSGVLCRCYSTTWKGISADPAQEPMRHTWSVGMIHSSPMAVWRGRVTM